MPQHGLSSARVLDKLLHNNQHVHRCCGTSDCAEVDAVSVASEPASSACADSMGVAMMTAARLSHSRRERPGKSFGLGAALVHCLMAWQTAILLLQSWRTAPGLLWKAARDLILSVLCHYCSISRGGASKADSGGVRHMTAADLA